MIGSRVHSNIELDYDPTELYGPRSWIATESKPLPILVQLVR